ncbi:MAG: hypothetical protein U9R56_07420, partial [candidate division Zixibacteria bacterium]|nr:hypothetical protein [candidate division Zixibacteria bacterium]
MSANNSSGTRIYAFDRLVIGYSLLMVAAILAMGRPITGYIDELIFYFGTATLAWVVVRYVNERQSRWHAFVR